MPTATMLMIRKLPDTSKGTRIPQYDPDTGEKILVNPETGLREPWPLLGVQIEGDPPELCRVPVKFVQRGRAEGWISVEGEKRVHRPAGPAEDQWAKTHTFIHYDAITFNTVDGDVRYEVVHQPDKYHADDDEKSVTKKAYAAGTTRVDHFYDLQLTKD